MAHTCSIYCGEGVHAYEVLATPNNTALTVAAHLRCHGFEVHDVRPAREADVEQWRTQMVTTYCHNQCYEASEEDMRDQTVPWLALIRMPEHSA